MASVPVSDAPLENAAGIAPASSGDRRSPRVHKRSGKGADRAEEYAEQLRAIEPRHASEQRGPRDVKRRVDDQRRREQSTGVAAAISSSHANAR